jgi:glucose-1-phosphate adenylyltransferase
MTKAKVLTLILAGGAGTRLEPLTANRCKPAVPFAGSFRIVDFTLLNCLASGLRQVHVLAQYHVQSLQRHLKERWSFLARELCEFIDVLPPKLRSADGLYKGTAHAVLSNLDLILDEDPDLVLILSGDHVYRADYRRLIEGHLQGGADLSILIGESSPEAAPSFGLVDVDAQSWVRRFVEKPADPTPFIREGVCPTNLGIYCFRAAFLVRLLSEATDDGGGGYDFGKDICPWALQAGKVLGVPIEAVCPGSGAYWRDVGTIDAYFDAHMDLLRSPPPFQLADPRWPPRSTFQDWVPAIYQASARIDGRNVSGRNIICHGARVLSSQVVHCVLSPGVEVGAGAELEECILLPGAKALPGARLRRAIVEEGMVVQASSSGCFDPKIEWSSSPHGVVVLTPPLRRPIDRQPAPAARALCALESPPRPRHSPRHSLFHSPRAGDSVLFPPSLAGPPLGITLPSESFIA